jgi:hypothetical protein
MGEGEKAEPGFKENVEMNRELGLENKRLREEQANERRLIQQKQIRGLRNNYRPTGGLLNSGIGSSPGLPNKLGSV